jgi:GT2 family glycosyltransferase
VRADAIVVAYRSGEIVGRCLDALRADPSVDRIVVVNNSPGDETERLVHSVDRVVYLESPGNVGFGRAVNSARPHVRHPYVVLVNPDAIQEPGTVGALLEFLEGHPLAGAAAPRMTGADGTPFPNSQHDLSLGRLVAESVGLPAALGVARPLEQHQRAHRTEYVIGSYLAARAGALDRIGWFDESIFLFGEDLDLCRRMRAAGWEVWFVPVGRVHHLSGHSWKQLPHQARNLFIEARHRELAKARGPVQAEAYRVLVTAKEWIGRLAARMRAPRRSRAGERIPPSGGG